MVILDDVLDGGEGPLRLGIFLKNNTEKYQEFEVTEKHAWGAIRVSHWMEGDVNNFFPTQRRCSCYCPE